MYLYQTQEHLAKNLKSPSQKLEKEAPDDNDSEGDDKQIITTSLQFSHQSMFEMSVFMLKEVMCTNCDCDCYFNDFKLMYVPTKHCSNSQQYNLKYPSPISNEGDYKG